jgi:hypothetical protein
MFRDTVFVLLFIIRHPTSDSLRAEGVPVKRQMIKRTRSLAILQICRLRFFFASEKELHAGISAWES